MDTETQTLCMAILEVVQLLGIALIGWQIYKFTTKCPAGTNLPWEARWASLGAQGELLKPEDIEGAHDLLCHTYCAVRTLLLISDSEGGGYLTTDESDSSGASQAQVEPSSSNEFGRRSHMKAS